LGPTTLGISRLSSYFGALAMLNIIESVINGAEGAT
jgi:hypothetical protein